MNKRESFTDALAVFIITAAVFCLVIIGFVLGQEFGGPVQTMPPTPYGVAPVQLTAVPVTRVSPEPSVAFVPIEPPSATPVERH